MSHRRVNATLLRDWARALKSKQVLGLKDRKVLGAVLENVAKELDDDQDALDRLVPAAFPYYEP